MEEVGPSHLLRQGMTNTRSFSDLRGHFPFLSGGPPARPLPLPLATLWMVSGNGATLPPFRLSPPGTCLNRAGAGQNWMGQPRVTAGKHTQVGYKLLRGWPRRERDKRGTSESQRHQTEGACLRERPGGPAEPGCLHFSSREFHKCRASFSRQGTQLNFTESHMLWPMHRPSPQLCLDEFWLQPELYFCYFWFTVSFLKMAFSS